MSSWIGLPYVLVATIYSNNLAQQVTLKEASWVVEGNLGREMIGGGGDGGEGQRDGDVESWEGEESLGDNEETYSGRKTLSSFGPGSSVARSV
jgi:hypothetical protein